MSKLAKRKDQKFLEDDSKAEKQEIKDRKIANLNSKKKAQGGKKGANKNNKPESNNSAKSTAKSSTKASKAPKAKSGEEEPAVSFEGSSDDSEDDYTKVRIGNVPMEWYNQEKNLGYDVKGQVVERKLLQNDGIDEFIKKSENPDWWRTVKDELNQKNITITDEQLDMIRRIRTGRYVNKKMEETAYEIPLDKSEFIHPMDNTLPPKRRFMPSKWERLKVNKILHAIQMGWIKLEESEEEQEDEMFDLWGDDFTQKLYKNLPPPLILPKTKRPTSKESYNPVEKDLMTKEQEQEWKESHPEDREIEFIPRKYDCLRKVEAYENMLKERFERCLDLYLAPRVKKRKVHMNPDDLLPELPPASSLKPFPSFANIYYRGHECRVRAIKVNLAGTHLLSGDEQGHLLMFDVKTSRILKRWKFEDRITSLDWSARGFVAVGEGNRLHILNPLIDKEEQIEELDFAIEEAKTAHSAETDLVINWNFVDKDSDEYLVEGRRFSVQFETDVSQIVFHKKGDYLATLTPRAANKDQVLIHSLRKGRSQRAFTKAKSDIQRILFHHTKPIMFIATKQTVWVFNLQTQVDLSYSRAWSGNFSQE